MQKSSTDSTNKEVVKKLYHFTYTSGANPYVAFSRNRKDSILRKYRKLGIKVENAGKQIYIIHDKEVSRIDIY